MCTLLVGTLALVAPVTVQAAIVVNDVEVTEGNGGVTATFTLTRSAALLAGSTSVTFATVDDSASSPADFLATSGTRGFPSSLLGGTQTQQVVVPIQGDRLDEPDESFRVAVSGAEVADGDGIGTIVDDDPPPAVGVGDAPAATEGGVASFAIGLSAPSGHNVRVAFATANGSATAGQDYMARTGIVTIPAGRMGATVAVALLDDKGDEPSESFGLRLSDPVAATLGDAVGTATILDDDEPSQAGSPPGGGGSQQQTTVPKGPSTDSSRPTSPSSTATRLGLGSPRLRQPATVLVTISCPQEAGRCSGRVTIFSRPNKRSKIKALRSERRLGRRTFAIEGGASRTLAITLGRRDRSLLNRSGSIAVRAYAVTQDGAGRTGVRTVNGTLLRRTAHSSPNRRR